jgi:LytS/YehU family sensor histidine kinase
MLSLLSFWGLYGCVTISGLALTIKLLKLWFIKEQKNIQLQKENFISKSQLLQSQIHPHFLFNTLNNIYSSTLPAAPAASQMIMRLSSLLRYILYECNMPAVLLEKEFDMIKEYIALETMRYDEKLEIIMELPERTNGYTIAPLLLLPFVENCFKHGTSTIIEKPWINLHVQLNEGHLFVKLVNGKAPDPVSVHAHGPLNGNGSKGIGIANVQSRLDLLYPGRHELKVINESEVFGISLRVELNKKHVYS